MPRVNVYIRKENEERWLALQDKSAWVNKRLKDGAVKVPIKDLKFAAQQPPTLASMQKAYEIGDKLYNATCKHGSDPKYCKHAKPGKPCK
jgi:hypothetical protein